MTSSFRPSVDEPERVLWAPPALDPEIPPAAERAARRPVEVWARHGLRTGLLAGALALELGWSQERVRRLAIAGRLHDVGKLLLPRELWSKPAGLSLRERELARTHAALGADWLAAGRPASPLAVVVARSHHERWDGSGYPDGLEAAEIPEAARIVAVADVYDALTEDRPYRPARSGDYAAAWIAGRAGKHFDPEVVAALVRFMRLARRRVAVPTLV